VTTTRIPTSRSTWRWTLAFLAGLLVAGAFFGMHLRQRAKVSDELAPLQRIPRNAPFIVSPDAVVDKMVEVGEISQSDLVYDLGCGDGRIVIAAAVQRGCHGIGFDIDLRRVEEATRNAQEQGVEHLVSFQHQDIFQLDLSRANVVMMYLLPWMLEKLVPQFEQCPAGTRIVSHNFSIAGFDADRIVQVGDGNTRHSVYLYVTPLKRSAVQPKWRNWKDGG
jgi:SAM-dependent methyltransferase